MLQNYHLLCSCYGAEFAPPKWAPAYVTDEHLESCTLYYDAKDNKSNAIKLLYARDPVNIAMDTTGSTFPFHRVFPDQPKGKSYVKQANKLQSASSSSSHPLPPNIAVYCKTPILNIAAPPISALSSSQKIAMDAKFVKSVVAQNPAHAIVRDVHVMNLVGYGFDTMAQPDAHFFCTNAHGAPKLQHARRMQYEEHVRSILRKLVRCAEQHQFKKIMVSEVGCGAFAGAENVAYTTEVFYKILTEELRKTPSSFELGLLGHPAVNTDDRLKGGVASIQRHRFFGGVHLIPDVIFERPLSELASTLFVNAWDPHSAVGNGNWSDQSLDGFFGRSTAMAAICHPYTNPYLTHTNLKAGSAAVAVSPAPTIVAAPAASFPAAISIDTTHGQQTTDDEAYAIWVSQFKSVHIKGYARVKIPQQLLIYVATKTKSDVRALRDENGATWHASVEFGANGKDMYYTSSNGRQSVTFTPLAKSTVKQPLPPTKKSVKKKHPGLSQSSSFTLSTCNCLYTENIHAKTPKDLCVYETELIPRSKGFPGQHPVVKKNLYWPKRVRPLVQNLMHDGGDGGDGVPPDVILLQETTPEMLDSLLQRMGGGGKEAYLYARSTYGMGSHSDGYCYVAWRADVFEQRNTETVPMAHHTERFVAVRLVETKSGREVAIMSTHLPASGSGNVFEILKTISHWKLPTIVGGDFNNEYQNAYFEKHGYTNLSGAENTFYNDSDSKYDWVIGNGGVASSSVRANGWVASHGRWPNEYEGSDHTALRLGVHLVS
jgi:hypothetical protein